MAGRDVACAAGAGGVSSSGSDTIIGRSWPYEQNLRGLWHYGSHNASLPRTHRARLIAEASHAVTGSTDDHR